MITGAPAASVVAWVALAWWCCALALFGLSLAAALAFPRPWPRDSAPGPAPSLTAIIPVKGLDPGFDSAQSSLFGQDYPGLEVLIASAEADSAALRAAADVQARHPDIASRVVVSQVRGAASPKLDNLWPAIREAGSDLILTKDSNVVLPAGEARRLVGQLGPGVGLVSAITILVAPKSAASLVEVSIINGHYARILMLARALGLGFGLGKVMLFRRSDLDRAGGLAVLAPALGEDSAIAAALARIGLRTVLADRLTYQSAGARSWRGLWDRLLRWKLIWRRQQPAAFVGSLLSSAGLAALAAALAAPMLRVPGGLAAAATLAAWCGFEVLICALKGWPLSPWSPIAFIGREALDLCVWLRALTTSEVAWAGAKCRPGRPYRPGFSQERLAP